MHIPDGFLSPPVWGALDAVAVPAVALAARRAQGAVEERNIPLLGVMGAFVFAAQTINFPVGLGTSGHLVGGALLAIVLGPAQAALAMTAILATQALVFQDGGILALGANILNMAFAGVLAGYLPYRIWGARRRSGAIFFSGLLSVLVSASLALSELLVSGVPMPRRVLWISLALFAVSAAIEGAITLAAVRAIERLNPAARRAPAAARTPVARVAVAGIAAAALILAAGGILIASAHPDGIQKLLQTPAGMEASWIRRAAAGAGGAALIFAACLATGRMLRRNGSA